MTQDKTFHDMTGACEAPNDTLDTLKHHLGKRLRELLELESNLTEGDLGIGIAIDMLLECLDILDIDILETDILD